MQYMMILILLLASALPDAFGESIVPGRIPVRGIHLMVPGKQDLGTVLEFVGEVLPKEGVNTLVLEFDYSFDFKSRSEFASSWSLDKADVRKIAAVCQEKGVRLIPQLNCLGHQSWAKNNGTLLMKHPEFDETPGKFPDNKDIYCRSYCPLHPGLHDVLFVLVDELIEACDAKDFHVGMDEIFILADADCPRCRGRDKAELFADEVKILHDHLVKKGCRMWMWGDRFIDGKATGIGEWEASTNGTFTAVEKVPKDIVICDWHYEKAHETARYFSDKGFDVVSCPWRKTDVALGQLSKIRQIRVDKEDKTAAHALGVLHTTWCGLVPFAKAYRDLEGGVMPGKDEAAESAKCFRALMKAARE